MKKVITITVALLFVSVVFLPLAIMISGYFGYMIELVSVIAFALITAALSVWNVVCELVYKCEFKGKAEKCMLALLTPLVSINSVFYMFSFTWGGFFVSLSLLISVGCSLYLMLKYVKHFVVSTSALILTVILATPAMFWCGLGFLELGLGPIREDTVLQTVESPNGEYYVQVLESNQGALGGDVTVDVHDNNGIDLLLFKIVKQPQRLIFGEWGSYHNADIYWKDNNCVVINSVEYIIE